MTRVIHTGDTHLGYRQYHVAERRADFLAAFRQVIDDAIDAEVDAVIHAGDLFHDRRPDLDDLLGTIDVLGTLADADIPFLAIVGNHEGTRDRQWLDLFEALGLATRLARSGVVVDEVTFYGLDYVPPSQREDLEYRFDPPETERTALVSHGLFEPFAHANWDTERLLDETNVDFDVVLLGDNHKAGQETVNGTWVTYCGSTERTSAAEREERGYNLVTFGDDVSIARRGLDVTRAFVFIDVELGEGEGIERVREQMRQHELEDAVVLVAIEGEGEEITPADVESFATDRGALVARVTDRREFDAETTHDVQFADPDDAVRKRIRELGLSGAARDIDEIVRASKVADSNVRENVESHVRSLLDEGVSSFETGDDTGDGEETFDEAGSETDDEGEEGEGDRGDGVEEESEPDDSEEDESERSDEAEDERETDGRESDENESGDGEKGKGEPERSPDEVEAADSAGTASASTDGGGSKPADQQSSFGEFQ